MGELLQHEEAPSGAGQPGTDDGMAGRRHRRLAGQRCGHDAALGRRWLVAHMPTATAAAVDSRGVRNKTEPGASNQARGVSGPTDGLQLRAPTRTTGLVPEHRPLSTSLHFGSMLPTLATPRPSGP